MTRMDFSRLQRILDLTFVVMMLPFGGLLCIVISILSVIIERNLKVFFLQKRRGRYGQIFTIIKFRTMAETKPKGELKVTPFGLLLRRTSLDEIPQLFNILFGQMSLVGPRPIIYEDSEKTREIMSRENVRPGLTGLAQITFRGSKRSLRQKMRYDLLWCKSGGICCYFFILVRTAQVIYTRYKKNRTGETF